MGLLCEVYFAVRKSLLEDVGRRDAEQCENGGGVVGLGVVNALQVV